MIESMNVELRSAAMNFATKIVMCSALPTFLACTDYVDYHKSVAGSGGTASNGGSGAAGGSSAGAGAGAVGGAASAFMLGADISSVDEEMDNGITYEDTDGTSKSIFDILKNHGFNFIRLRAFVKPGALYGYDYGTGASCVNAATYCDTAHTVAFAQRVKAAGMGVLLDLHYSDNWADPGHQIIPEDWRNARSIDELASDLQAYTQDVVSEMVNAGVRPDIVQIGNEITPGLLRDIPNSTTDCWGNNVSASAIGGSAANWTNLGTLLKAGAAGIKAIDGSIKVMVHIENTRSASGVVAWVTNALGQGVPFDIVGLSCYDVYQGPPANWQAAFNALAQTFPTLSFTIAEYNGQRTEANSITYGLPGGRGIGTFFWEPTESGSWGPGLFTLSGSAKVANVDAFAEFDAIAATVGLK